MRMILSVKVHVYQKVGFEMVRLIALMDLMRLLVSKRMINAISISFEKAAICEGRFIICNF